MNNVTNHADGQFVVIQDGKRVTGVTPSQQEATNEADRRNKIAETQSGQRVSSGKAQVKRNLLG